MVFEEYLSAKKINHETFLWANPEQYTEMKKLFMQMHPESFTMQKKFLINDWRRKYCLVK
jgi:hypothetical protein